MIGVICVCGTNDYNPSHDQHGVPRVTVFKDVNLDKPVIGSYRNSEPKFRQALVHYFTNKTNALYLGYINFTNIHAIIDSASTFNYLGHFVRNHYVPMRLSMNINQMEFLKQLIYFPFYAKRHKNCFFSLKINSGVLFCDANTQI